MGIPDDTRMPQVVIARELGISPQAVASIEERAIRKLWRNFLPSVLNLAELKPKRVCSNCNSGNVQNKGNYTNKTKTRIYKRLYCRNCYKQTSIELATTN